MKRLDFSEFDEETLDDVVRYLNYFAGSRVFDDPNFTAGSGRRHDYTIGAVVQRRIRNMVGGGAFMSEPAEIEQIRGFWQDKLRDVAFTVREGLDRRVLRLVAPMISHKNHAEAFVNGPTCLDVILDEIGKAQHFIHVQMMLFYSDDVGWQVANALRKRAVAGVTVRVMADAETTRSGYWPASQVASSGEADFGAIADALRGVGAQVIDTHEESYWDWDWKRRRAELSANGVPAHFLVIQDAVQKYVQANWNVVDHRKFIVIDGVTSIIGSLNIGGQYLYAAPLDNEGLPSQAKQWHDGMLRIRGPFADALNELFASTWTVRGGDVYDYTEHHRSNEPYGTDQCTLVASFPGAPTNPIREMYLTLPAHSAGEVIIENPYMNDEWFFKALNDLSPECAAHITLINPYSTPESDYPVKRSAIRCNMYAPAALGVRFFDYSRGKRMSHWKTALDLGNGLVCHGSYNLNYRSALHDFEAVAVVRSDRLADEVRGVMEHDLAVSDELARDEFFERPSLHASCNLLWAVEQFA